MKLSKLILNESVIKITVKSSNINFIATYSLTETDLETHEKFAKYLLNFNLFVIFTLWEKCKKENREMNQKWAIQFYGVYKTT